ncbi:hypothetical protein MRX96_016497 [Rhipicephalus microplus]
MSWDEEIVHFRPSESLLQPENKPLRTLAKPVGSTSDTDKSAYGGSSSLYAFVAIPLGETTRGALLAEASLNEIRWEDDDCRA